jgi:ferritin-like metal-binding protein YciE
MGVFTKDIKTVNDLLLRALADIYYAEQQIVKALPEMVKKATDVELKEGFQSHIRQCPAYW